MHWLVISKPSWGWDGAASSGATCRQPSHVFQCLLSFSGYFYLDHLLRRLSELVLDQAHRHEWTFCSWNRSHWNIAIQIVESNGNKSEICCSLHYIEIVMISMYFLLHVLFLNVHTQTQIVSLYDVLFWTSRKHGPCLRGSPSDAFSHAMELLDSWTSWGSYAKTQGASKAVWVVKSVVMVLESLVTVWHEL